MDLIYSFPVELVKSGTNTNGRIPITIYPSHPSFDRQNDKIILKAFDDDCVNGFLTDGVIDYDHQSILAKSQIERAQAIIGEPENLYIDKNKNIPVCEGFLFEKNPYVKNSIAPALDAKSKVFGASLGGRILRKSATNIDEDVEGNIISKITLKHIAITPLQKAVHQKTSIMLRKSMCSHDGSCGNKHCKGKCDEKYELDFDSYDTFVKSFEDDSLLSKALEAGVQTDISKISGGQALQEQSLEGDGKKRRKKKIDKMKIKKHMHDILFDLIKGRIGPTYSDYTRYLGAKGFNEDEIEDTVRLLAMNGAKIVKLVI